MRVEHGKVADDDRYGQSDGEHAGKCTESSYEHANIRFRRHITVTYGSHGDDSPPQAQRNTLELVIRIILSC